MIIRKLKDNELKQAIDIKSYCWSEDFAGIIPKGCYEPIEELDFITKWIKEECNDIRVIYGAFIGEKLVGFIGASIAEKEDIENGIEINYLFMKKEYRNKGTSLKLLKTVVDFYITKDFEKVIVYNWHEAESNGFYQNIGGEVLKQITQKPGGKIALVDIFVWDINELRDALDIKIEKLNM
ncbi:GNAT family N-acetyltransferase [Dethiothermospora halolimnae]|uniref:GNAT family N-acetyltransferase n=1 Tax=Dethiothermospora halolimnae TaxID=3114390 RepID=UPI003CCC0245